MILIACDSPLALPIFDVAVALAWTTVWLAITCTPFRLFGYVKYFWNATTFDSTWLANAGENLKSVMNTVSTIIFLADSVLAIAWAITAFAVALFVISSSALYLGKWAPMNHKTRILGSLYNISFLATDITHGERGIIEGTVSVVEETKNAAREIIELKMQQEKQLR